MKSVDSITDRLGNTTFYIALNKGIGMCQTCGVYSKKTNGTQTVKVHHQVVIEKNITLRLKKYRYICDECNKTFIQQTSITAPRGRVSYVTKRRIMELAKDPRMTFKLISQDVKLSVTAVISIFFENIKPKEIQLPFALCIDEVYLGRKSKKKYAVVLMDFQTGKIVELIYGRSVDDCFSVLGNLDREKRYKVKLISTDMYRGFHRLAKSTFPKAEICVDSFHVIKLISDSLQKLIISKMKNYDKESNEYYLLKSKRYVVFKNQNSKKWFERRYDKQLKYYISDDATLKLILDLDKEIEDAVILKNRYQRFNKMTFDEKEKALLLEEELDTLIKLFKKSTYDGYKTVGKTIEENKLFIINSFTKINGRRISNGPIESRNAIIKMIIKTSGGYRNFNHLRARALYVLNND